MRVAQPPSYQELRGPINNQQQKNQQKWIVSDWWISP